MSQIASKNLYELLGNDPELDPNREPEPPTKVIDKPIQRAGKRNAGAEGPSADTSRPAAGGRGGRHEVLGRADAMGSLNNRAEKKDDGLRQDRHANRNREPREHRGIGDGPRSSRGRGRGARGGEYRGTRTARDDRHNHSNVGDNEKQAAHGWGGQDGQSELNDETAGAAIAKAEAGNEGFTPDTSGGDPAFSNGPDGATGADDVAEPEEKTKSYDEYMAELAEKRLAIGADSLNVRKPNEGSKQKFPEGTAHTRETEEYFAGTGGKQTRQKENKPKNLLTMDTQYYAPPDSGDRGGRGGARGGRGRGEGRGGRGRGEGRGGRGRGDFNRAPRGDGPRGAPRGAPRGGAGINTKDESAFPSLGA